jgi:hypothetical protein
MILEKPLSKMLKKELVKVVKDYQTQEKATNKSLDQAEAYRERRQQVENKLKEERHEAITALEVWKSGYLEMQETNTILQNRLATLRQMMQLELIKTPLENVETKEEQSNIIHSIVQKLARKLIDMEDKVKPILHDYLPIPRIIKIMQTERDRKEKEKKRIQLENELPQGFFTHKPA